MKTEIAKVEAEEGVCAEFLISNEQYCTGENWQKLAENETADGNEAFALRRPNENNTFAPMTQHHNTTMIKSNPVSSQL